MLCAVSQQRINTNFRYVFERFLRTKAQFVIVFHLLLYFSKREGLYAMGSKTDKRSYAPFGFTAKTPAGLDGSIGFSITFKLEMYRRTGKESMEVLHAQGIA